MKLKLCQPVSCEDTFNVGAVKIIDQFINSGSVLDVFHSGYVEEVRMAVGFATGFSTEVGLLSEKLFHFSSDVCAFCSESIISLVRYSTIGSMTA